jgi:hypothetical protein
MKLASPQMQKLALSMALLLMLFISGCSTGSGGSSSPGGSGGSRTLKQTDVDVSWPMTRFRSAVAAGTVTQGEQDQVNGAYARYRSAYEEALQAANNNGDAAAPDNVTTLATQVISAVQASQ